MPVPYNTQLKHTHKQKERERGKEGAVLHVSARKSPLWIQSPEERSV